MAGRLFFSPGDPDLLKLLVLWEVEKNSIRYELVEGELYLETDFDGSCDTVYPVCLVYLSVSPPSRFLFLSYPHSFSCRSFPPFSPLPLPPLPPFSPPPSLPPSLLLPYLAPSSHRPSSLSPSPPLWKWSGIRNIRRSSSFLLQ